MLNAIARFIRDEEGATAIEYGIIAGLMAVILVAIFGTNGSLATAITDAFGRITSALSGS
jgi:pilus assembly protein Flp/PilA